MRQMLQTKTNRECRGRALLLFVVLGIAAFALFICIVFFLLPLISALVSVFFVKAEMGGSGLLDLARSRIAPVFLFTIFHAFFSSLLALCVGFFLAFFCANRTFIGKKLLLSLSAIPFTLPPLIIALSYILFFGNNGVFFTCWRRLCNVNVSSFLYSIVGIVMVQGMYNFPIAMQGISEAWQKVPKNEIAAATLLRASPFFIFRTITLPHILPSIFSSFLLIFLFCFFSFVIALMFGGVGVSTIEVELYKCATHFGNAKTLGSFFLAEFSFALILVLLHSYFHKRCEIEGIEISHLETKRMLTAEKIIFAILVFFIFFFLILPLISIFLFSFHSHKFSIRSSSLFSNFSFSTWHHVFSSHLFWRSFFSSIYVGVCTTILSILATMFYTFCKIFIVKSKWMDILPFLPLATSSVMLASGWRFLAPNVSYCVGQFMLICCQSSLFWVFAIAKVNIAVKNAVPTNLIDASLLLSQSKIKTFFSLILPLISPSLKTASATVFAMSIADASLPLVLGIEGFTNLSLLLFDYASSYRFGESAAIGSLLLLLSMIVFFVSSKNKQKM